ncbi:Protein winged eye [Pseudolycoriella hygida]|uniref:Protein winged eye n=1 Tax=Pseudolycoriella hygida TaxID=35572 RepID=A0A9Q0RUJ0_9DIPT|nr:Protein winged eye [Pseudolycoriella hygida]
MFKASLPVESMIPVGCQLVRDPSTGQVLLLPTPTSLEPFQQAVVWPSYSQQLQTPHLLMPPMAPLTQQMQPPPLTPIQLLGTDYLSGATLHQHTQTHSTRLVALTSDNKRKSCQSSQLPLPATLIKIEDCSSATTGNTSTSSHHQQSHLFDPCKSTTMQTIATAVQTSNMTPELEMHHQMYYQSEGNLIQIAPHNEPCRNMMDAIEARSLSPLSDRRDMSPTNENLDNSTLSLPEVQDANIQTDTPVMSEDDNTTGDDDCTFPSNTSPTNDSSAITTSASSSDMCHNVSSLSEINSSNSLNHQNADNTKTHDSSFDSNTTVTSSITFEEIPVPQPETILLSSYESSESIDTDQQQSYTFTQKNHAPDLSGLELLSNSIEAFEKKTFIKQEPIEKAELMYSMDTSVTQTEPIDCSMHPKEYVSEPLGGLDLLCVLAEQRFQEEVGQRSRKRSLSTDGSDSKRQKKLHKDKQSSKKSNKKSKQLKERRESRSKRQETDEDDDDSVEKNLNETFNRVKASYQRQCSCKRTTSDGEGCCYEKCNFPTPEEVYSAMHTDMKQKLTAIAKEFQEKKRKLNEIKNLDKMNHSRESTPSSSSKSFSFDSEHSTKSELISPNISSSSQSETFQADSSKMQPDTESMRFDEADTSSSAYKQRKIDTNLVDSSSLNTMKSKSLVGYIFATKKRLNDSKTDNSSSMTDETSQSDMNSIKQEVAGDEELSQEALFGPPKRESKHQSKHKKSKSKDRKHRRSSESKSKKRKIDARCNLTEEQLDNLSTTARVLTALGGLFYAGCLGAVQPKNVYSIILDGERGNKPRFLTREEILRDAVLHEVAPRSADEVPPGTRLCAYWSEKYRCLYPGTAAHPSSDDYEFDPKFVTVEFDDGDSGRIPIEHVRFLKSDYPIVDYDPNPLATLGKRKQRSSQSETHVTSESINEPTTSTNCFSIFKDKIKNEDKEAQKERRRLKKIRKDKNKSGSNDDKKHKHKHKHKKRRKHKKHYHRDAESPVEVKSEIRDEETPPQDDSVSQTDDSNERNDEVFSAEIKEETMTEEEATSSITESSGSNYKPAKKKERQNSAENHSKIAAFLPARQLWAWSGKGIKRSGPKGRGRKQFYRTIQRGKETISVGDSAVFLSTGRPDRPYIGRIECMWETTNSNRIVRVKWYYHPEEATGCPTLVYPGGLFQSPHEDENDVQTISHKCKVLPFVQYTEKYGPDPKQYESVYDNNDTFYLAGSYDPTSIVLTLENNIPSSSKVIEKKASKVAK